MAAPQPMPPPAFMSVRLARGSEATIRDPAPCARDAGGLRVCTLSDSGTHTDLERLILGDLGGLGLENNYDNPNQTGRYDVVLQVAAAFASGDLRTMAAAVNVQRAGWILNGAVTWRVVPTPVVSGLIYISSGRADWFGKSGLTSPLVMWALSQGHACDIVTDVAEYPAYLAAVGKNRPDLAVQLHAYMAASGNPVNKKEARRRVNALITVTAPVQIGAHDINVLPRGFGFNRWVGMEWMRARFTGICATVDDNTFMLTRNLSATALDWLFTANNVANRAAAINSGRPNPNDWLAVAFSPCTLAIPDRQPVGILAAQAGQPPAYNGNTIQANRLPGPLILQQMTLWNAARYRQLNAGGTLNYDARLVTGKEDVEFSFRLLAAGSPTEHLLFRDNSLHLVKCGSTSTRCWDKEKAITSALKTELSKLSRCLRRAFEDEDQDTLKAIAGRFYSRGATPPDSVPERISDMVRRINMALDQIVTFRR